MTRMVKIMKKKKMILIIVGVLIITSVCYLMWGFIENKIEESRYLHSEEGVIQTFNDNYDLFAEVVSCFEDEPGNFYLCTTSLKRYVSLNSQDIKLESYEKGEQISYILNELGFTSIYEDDDSIMFMKSISSGEQRGVQYSKAGKKLEDVDELWGQTYPIKDDWYYSYFCNKS